MTKLASITGRVWIWRWRKGVRFLKRLSTILVLLTALVGCMSQIRPFQEYADGWVGKPIAALMAAKAQPGSYASRSGWQENKYSLANGNWVYVSPEREGCIMHWEVNSKGTIITYHAEGNRCDW